MENTSPLAHPNNGPSIFAVLRDVLADLYPEENDARVVVADAGLDAKQIPFSARAQTNWHNILAAAIRQARLDPLLKLALANYVANPALLDAYGQYQFLIDQGGSLEAPAPLPADADVTITGDVNLNQGDFVGRDKHIAGDEVSANKIEGDQIDAHESRGFIHRPTGPVTQHYGNTIHIGAFKIPKPLAWAVLALIVISVGFIGYIAMNTGWIRAAITAPTAIPTTTPPPTATPLAFATEAPGETLIVIATFLVTEGNRNTFIHREIRDRIHEEAQKAGESNLRVVYAPTILASDQQEQAKALGLQYHASMVIWGDDTGARITVNFLNLRQPDFDASAVTISETERTQITAIANPKPYNQFIVDDLPRQLTFLSLFAVGQSYYINQDYPHAIEAIEVATASLQENVEPPGLAEAFFRLGWLYQVPTPNNLSKAIANYDKAILLDPDNALAYNNRGLARFDQGQLGAAIADYDQAIQLSPDLAGAYNNRGNTRFEQGKLDAAIADYDQAIQLDPDDAIVYDNRGSARKAQGKLAEAIADYDQAIQLNSAYANAYNNRGLARFDQGKLAEAIADYDQAIQLKPDYAYAYNNRGLARFDQGKLEKAIADYDQAIQLNPDLAEAYNNRGSTRKAQGKLAEAIADYDQAIQLNPTYAEAYNNRGSARKVQGKLDVAITDYGQAIQLNPDLAEAYNNRGLARFDQGKLAEAIADYDQAIQLNPAYADAYNNRGIARKVQGKLAEAIADYDQAIQLDPDDAIVYYNRGLARYTQGKLDVAITDYDKAIEINPNLANAFGVRGLAYWKLGKPKEALADLHRSLELQPNAENRSQVESLIVEIETELAKLK